MRFIIPINEVEDGGSQTVQVVTTASDCAKTNKKILRSYFEQVGVPKKQIKRVMKAMGFWGDRLGK
jgi:hypothetical protein